MKYEITKNGKLEETTMKNKKEKNQVEITLKTKDGQVGKTTVDIRWSDDFMLMKTTAIGGSIEKIRGKYFLRAYGSQFQNMGLNIPKNSRKREIAVEIIDGIKQGEKIIKKMHKNDKKDTCISCGRPVEVGRNGSYTCRCGHSVR